LGLQPSLFRLLLLRLSWCPQARVHWMWLVPAQAEPGIECSAPGAQFVGMWRAKSPTAQSSQYVSYHAESRYGGLPNLRESICLGCKS